MDGVQTASVQLAIPEKSVFVDEEEDPTASVFVATKNGAQLGSDQVQAIVHLTSAAVEGMQPTDVSVVDQKGQTLSAVGTGATGSGTDQAADYDAATSKKIQDLLDTTLGAGNASVVVAATMSDNSGTRTTESYTTPTTGPVALNESSTKEEYGAGAGAGANATGVLGPDNIAVPNGTADGAAGTDDGYQNESATKNNAVDKTTETTQIPAGAMDRQTISVALNSKAESVQGVNLQSINDLVANAAGVDAARGDQVKVAVMDFDTSAADDAAKALEAQQQAEEQEALWSAIRTAGIVVGIVLALVALMVFLARRSRRQQREQVDIGELDAFGDSFQLPLAVEPAEHRSGLDAGDAPTVALQALPVEDAPTEVLTTDEITAERRRQDITALAERDPKRTAEAPPRAARRPGVRVSAVVPAPGTDRQLTGAQKVALILMQMETERAAEVMKQFSELEAEEISAEIVRMRRVDDETVDRTLGEFHRLTRTGRTSRRGGKETALGLLEASFGAERAAGVMDRLASNLAGQSFEFLDDAEPGQVIALLEGELPQTIALVLAHLKPAQASAVLAGVDERVRTDVAQAFATMGTATPESVGIVAGVLRARAGAVVSPRESVEVVGGIAPLVEIINRSDVATEKAVLDGLEARDPELAEDIRSRMLTFEDIVKLESRDIQQVLRGIDSKILATAMKGASAPVVETIRANVSERNRELLDDELQSMGPVRVSQVEEARAEVVRSVRELEAQGVITVHRAEEDEAR